ncbi:porin family protein [Cochleicola gelatinilyticus]|uniref:Outer membrane protein beta-barrel domain-containing protein n=1 Tax=Cochleicola gelatinilyticus TaxID=1763537 RepID=A0A167H344_9FLAO|nr:porin family protein [Cochleicola gelatinilyticus]OAB78166.1 hypothetical protein ULVI_11840 [Cochleicola gelatinilyticus]
MKKVFLVAAVAVFGVSTTFAQADFRMGAKAGVNFAKLTGDDVEDADGRTGFHVGGLVEIPVTEKFSIQPEVLYSQQGLQRKDEFAGTTVESKLILDYINIPVMAKFYVTDEFSLEGGPQFGFRAKSEFETNIDEDGNEGETTIDLKDDFSSFDLGAGIGAAYRLPMGVFFQARYVLGLSNVNDAGNDSEDGIFEDDLTNSVLSLSVGYKF